MKINYLPGKAVSFALALFIFLSKTVLAQDPPTAISTPGPQYVSVGSTAYFTVTASGTSPFNFQWQRDGTNINNGGRYTEANVTAYYGATFDIANVDPSDSDTYQVIVTNQYGMATSGPVVLSVGYPPSFDLIDPVSETVKLGGTAQFDAAIGGTPPFTFNWQLNGADIPADNRVSSTNEPLIISPVEASDAGTYTITRISNAYGNLSVSGFYGVLTVLLPPSINTQPQDQTVPAGTNATFSVSATSPNGSITYQWYFNGTNIPWAQAASMTLTNVQATNTGGYYAILSNTGGSVTSAVAQLTVQTSAPWFINPLPSQTVPIGANVTFDPTARGSAPLSFQWQLNGTNLSATSATFNIASAQTNNSGPYLVIVTNNYGSATSAVATLIVENPPQIIGQPASQDALLGSNANLTVTATGTALNYQWYFGGVPLTDGSRINGSATATLNIANVQTTDAGGYFVVVSNLSSSVTSLIASLTPQSAISPSMRYVMLTSTNPLSPYLDWSTAATNIQDAVDASVPGDSVVVSNGLYNYGGRLFYGTNTTNRVVINKPITVQSLNGPAVTIVAGANSNPQLPRVGRCVYLTNGAFLSGFTLTGGGAAGRIVSGDLVREQSGGAAWCESGAVISNCVISSSTAPYGYGGGVFGGTVINSLLGTNTGAAVPARLPTSCSTAPLRRNNGEGALGGVGTAPNDFGGGAYGSTLSNCVLAANFALNGGGACGSVLFNCVLTNNTATTGAGGTSNVLYNCLLAYNLSRSFGGGAYYSTLYNCTVVTNSAPSADGAGIWGGAVTNCILYYNGTGNSDIVNTKNIASICSPVLGTLPGCITNAPLFVNLIGSDFHLQSNSPCINSGNSAYVTVSTDFAGNPRIVGGAVDMGAYEFQSPSSLISYAWLQQYGLPTDGSVDYSNLDGTTFTVYQDYLAGLNPTNPASVLQANLGVFSSGITILWPSVSTRNYYVQRSTNLVTQPFITIQSFIAGHTGTASYTDTTATNGGPYYYRVGVQQP